MSHQVIWTKIIVETFIVDANLSKEQEMIIRTRAAGWTRTQQAMKLSMSLSKVDKITKRLKVKYDAASRYNPLLPPRKFSVKETYMDEH